MPVLCINEDGSYDDDTQSRIRAIKKYARRRGLKKVKINFNPVSGFELEGHGKDESGLPLVWAIAKDLGIGWGAGNYTTKQIDLNVLKFQNNANA